MRMGDRLYVSYWHHGFYILDIADMSKPKLISGGNTSPAFPHPTHTCLPMPKPLKGREIMVVADEDVAKLWPAAPAFAWIYDITDETLPDPDRHLPGGGAGQGRLAAAADDGLPPALGALQGQRHSLRLVRPGPAHPRHRRSLRARARSAFYEPDPPQGATLSSSNDVTIDDRGLCYLIDRQRGVDIIETSVL